MISQNNKLNSKKVLLPLFLVLLIFLISINLQFFTFDKNNLVIENDTQSEINDLKLSGVSEKISIVGEQGWIDFKNAGNCTGSGTYSDPFVIRDLVIDGHGSGSGIKINLSRNYFFRIENCTIFNCSYGIELISTNNGTLYNNDCSFNDHGIYLHFPYPRFTPEEYGCFNNTIIKNTANNNNYGIYLIWGVLYNLIYGNIIRDNLNGIIVMGGSEYNLFYEKFFIGNPKHVDEGSTTNKWNNTEIGNYWDNYTGVDANGDGIGDSPHIIEHSSLLSDYLPIVDNLTPVITINSPNSNQDFVNSPSFNVSLEEKYLYVMWYTLDGGLNNFSFTENSTINQDAWSSLRYGSVNLQFYAIDKTGKIGFAEITINKKGVAIPGYNLSLLLTSILFFGLIIVRVNLSRVLIRKR